MAAVALLSGHGEVSGGEVMLLALADALRAGGHDVSVVGPAWGELIGRCRDLGLPYESLGGRDRRTYALALTTYCARPHGRLLWANGAMPGLATSAARASTVIHLHQALSARQESVTRWARSRARAVVVPSRFMTGVVPGSVALTNWTRDLVLRPDRPYEPARTVVTYIGRLSTIKGVDLLADALVHLGSASPAHRITLRVAGDARFVPASAAAPVTAALSRLAARMEVQQLGWVGDTAALMRDSDVVVVPSRWDEPFGLVAAEAMAVGCPVVVSSAGALPEVVGPQHPWIFERGSVTDLARVLGDLIARTPDPAVVDRARRRWESEYSPQAGRERVVTLMAELGHQG